ncbi:hypothetical protein V1525DRAFT_426930 [Lipomyces kononenkoae]|uniref:Uncharacterized protein n=1 Tax=Lipomyces kononenkoae TaxID=34357 RepID=A0ACC3SZG6_LIPKO
MTGQIVFPVESPAVVITDADKALMAALSDLFPTNCRKYFDCFAALDEFMNYIKGIASSMDVSEQERDLAALQDRFPHEAVDYFLNQWWKEGQCERWVEYHTSRHANFGMNTTSRVLGSNGAMKRALGTSSGTLYAAGQINNRSGAERSAQHSIISSTENLFVRVDIRNKIETSMLCTRISRSALELVYTEVACTTDKCNCAVRTRYLLPCAHQIQLGVPIEVAQIHPRWRVQAILPVLDVAKQAGWQTIQFNQPGVY